MSPLSATHCENTITSTAHIDPHKPDWKIIAKNKHGPPKEDPRVKPGLQLSHLHQRLRIKAIHHLQEK